MKMLLVRRQTFERVGRAELGLGEWNIAESSLAPVRPPPFGQDQRPVEYLADLEPVLILFIYALAPSMAVIAGIFGAAAFLDRNQGEMEIAVRFGGGLDKHAGDGGIASLERFKRQLRRRIGVFQGEDKLVRFVHCVSPEPQQFLGSSLLRAIIGRFR